MLAPEEKTSKRRMSPTLMMMVLLIPLFIMCYWFFRDWAIIIALLLSGAIGGYLARSIKQGSLSGLKAGVTSSILYALNLQFDTGVYIDIDNIGISVSQSFLSEELVIFGIFIIILSVAGALGGALTINGISTFKDDNNDRSFQVFCANCGRIIENKSQYCPTCGVALE
ncbi:MAG: hypothetical protein ACXAEU_25335 [Candidatus Hodarchaeales archaeon]|jgi:hypothetical protein